MVDPSKINPGDKLPIKPDQQGQQPAAGDFQKHLDKPAQSPASQVSPMDLAAQNRTLSSTPPTPEALQQQAESMSSSLGDIQNQLQTKNLKLKQSQKYLLRNKLSDADTNIAAATEHAGGKPSIAEGQHSRQSPIMKFMGMVENSQRNIQQTQETLKQISSSGQSVDPGKLLLVQVKLAKAQQDIEYSSILLSKAVDDVKTLFNIQL